ncbi:MAG: S1C family serine protease, partial [Bacteroidota bacterium]
MNRTPRLLRWLLWMGLIAFGFFAGISWKNQDPAPIEAEEQSALESDESTATLTAAAPSESQDDWETNLTSQEKHTIQLFEKASPSVAFITTTNVRRDFWTRNTMEIPRGNGSGFVWDKEGHIITNYH